MSVVAYTPIFKLEIVPSYSFGFSFSWKVDPTFADPLPWTFSIEEGETSEGPWRQISPLLDSKYFWQDNTKRVTSKDPVLAYRLKLATGKDVYYSAIIAPYFELVKHDYLLIKEIMRNELQQFRKLGGVYSRIWLRSQSGPPCPKCLDPVIGGSLNSHCDVCYGTGRAPGYNGPYTQWIMYVPTPQQHTMESDNTANKQTYDVQCRLIGYPLLSKRDIIVDPRADKRYFVDVVNYIAEIRNVPIVQLINATELPNSEPVYKLPL